MQIIHDRVEVRLHHASEGLVALEPLLAFDPDRAIESIDADPFVRELVENFDARIKDASIKPLQ